MFERLRAAVNAALDAAMPPPDLRELRAQMHRAAVEGRAAVQKMRDDLAQAERALTSERAQLAAARRRGQMAAEIDDEETVEVARRFASKHEDRVAVLEQKVAAQRAEVALAAREVDDMVAQLKELERRGGVAPGPPGVGAAFEHDDRRLEHDLDRAQREAQADARLQELKKRMGK